MSNERLGYRVKGTGYRGGREPVGDGGYRGQGTGRRRLQVTGDRGDGGRGASRWATGGTGDRGRVTGGWNLAGGMVPPGMVKYDEQ